MFEMLNLLLAVLLAVHSFFSVSVAARPWLVSGKAWMNSTAQIEARHSLPANHTVWSNTTAHIVTRSTNSTSSENSTAHTEARRSVNLLAADNTTIHVPFRRSLNLTSKANATAKLDKRLSLRKTTTEANTTFLREIYSPAKAVFKRDVVAWASKKLFHVRRSLRRKDPQWTNSTTHIEARRVFNFTTEAQRSFNLATRVNSTAATLVPRSPANFTAESLMNTTVKRNVTTWSIKRDLHIRRSLQTNGTRWANSTA